MLGFENPLLDLASSLSWKDCKLLSVSMAVSWLPKSMTAAKDMGLSTENERRWSMANDLQQIVVYYTIKDGNKQENF